jgi:tetratricopeptide (TPR) repeat protein
MELDAGAYEPARLAAVEAAEVAERTFGPEDARTISTVQIVALAYLSERRHTDALPPAELAFRSSQRLHRENSKHPLVINTRSTYARALAANGQVEQAIEHLEQARSDATEVLGADNRMVGFFSQNLVRLQLQANRVADAIVSAENALEIMSAHVQRRSFTFAAALNARGNAYLAARRAPLALSDYDAAIEIGSEALGANHENLVGTRLKRIQALAFLGRFTEAQSQLASLPETSQSAALRLQTTALLLQLSGRHTDALSVQQQYIEKLRQDGSDPRELVCAQTDMGLMQLSLEDLDSATATLRAAREDMQSLAMTQSPSQADAAVGLGRTLMQRGDAKAASTYFLEADAFWRELDPQNRWAGEAALWLGRSYLQLGSRKEAAEAFSRARTTLSRSALPSDANLLKLAKES